MDAKDFVNKFPNLQIFQLDSNVAIDTSDEQTLQTLLDGLKNLKSFTLSEESLSIRELSANDLLNYSQKGILLQNLNPKLETLKISGQRIKANVSTNSNFGTNLINLCIHDLYDFNLLSNVSHLESLKYFEFTSKEEAIDIDMYQIFGYISKMIYLRKLIIDFLVAIDPTFRTVTDKEIKRLRSCREIKFFHLVGVLLSDDSFESIARYLPNITSLKLEFCSIASNSIDIWKPLRKVIEFAENL